MMGMSKVAFAVGLTMALAGLGASFSELTPDERKERIRNAKRLPGRPGINIAQEGGLVTKPQTGRVLRIADSQDRVRASVAEDVAKDIELMLRIPVECAAAPVDAPSASILDGRTGAVVQLVDRPGEPSLLVAPEAGWAVVNIAALAADTPTSKTLRNRAAKELWRAAAYVLGAADSTSQPCLMREIHKPSDLDALITDRPSPEPFNKMMDGAESYGIERFYTVTYRKACEEGWAPSPTNDVQRAIWEQVSADKERGPTNTRPIKFRGRR